MHYQSLRGGNTAPQPLPCHEKIKILFEIVRQARQPDKLKDAKDVFDFLQFEIDCIEHGKDQNPRLSHQPKKPDCDSDDHDRSFKSVERKNPFEKTDRGAKELSNRMAVENGKPQIGLNSFQFMIAEVKNLRSQLEFLAE